MEEPEVMDILDENEDVEAEELDENARLQNELDEARAEVEKEKREYLFLMAEFDNYRKRTLREKMELVQTGGRDVLLAMLPVRDDVQRAVTAMEKSDDLEALRAGVQLISQKFTEALRQKGVTEIEVLDTLDGGTMIPLVRAVSRMENGVAADAAAVLRGWELFAEDYGGSRTAAETPSAHVRSPGGVPAHAARKASRRGGP